MKRLFFLTIISVMFTSLVFAQEHYTMEHQENRNGIGLGFGYTYVHKAIDFHDSEEEGFFVPFIGIDYIRKLNDNWDFITIIDFELDHYLISGEEIQREKATIVIVGARYMLIDELGVFMGMGAELDEHHTLFVGRAGASYSIHINHNWAITPAIFYDYKNIHSTFSTLVGLGYHF